MKNYQLNRLELLLGHIFAFKVIPNCAGDAYLIRWYIFSTSWITLFLHKFVRGDEDRALHCHPWSFLVVPIWRGYIEHSDRPMRRDPSEPWRTETCSLQELQTGRVATRRRVWPIISARYRPATYRHRVELIAGKPSWSIFFHFRRQREWGFHPPDGFVHWKQWHKSHNCE